MGRAEGFILEQRRGENGFGYDPIFMWKNIKIDGGTKFR